MWSSRFSTPVRGQVTSNTRYPFAWAITFCLAPCVSNAASSCVSKSGHLSHQASARGDVAADVDLAT